MLPSTSFKTVKLLRYVTPSDFFVLACEVIFCAFIVYYVVEELIEIRTIGIKYFANIWNLLDVVVIAVSSIFERFPGNF